MYINYDFFLDKTNHNKLTLSSNVSSCVSRIKSPKSCNRKVKETGHCNQHAE